MSQKPLHHRKFISEPATVRQFLGVGRDALDLFHSVRDSDRLGALAGKQGGKAT